MSDNDGVTIKIGGDPSGFKAAVTDSVATAGALNASLEKLGAISGEIFDKLLGQVTGAFDAFKEDESASNALTAALQTQGIYSDGLAASYKGFAEELQKTTGIQSAQTIQALASAQAFLGQVPVTKQLTGLIADYSTKAGGMATAAIDVGKAISTGTGGLLRQGLQFEATDSTAERYAKTIAFLTARYGGQAEAADKGLASIKNLQAALHDQASELGERFAPAMTAAIGALTDFLTPSKAASGSLTDMKAAFIAVALVLAGVGIALPIIAQGFLAVRAAAIALQVGAAPLLLIPAAIALVVAGIVLLGLHWKQVSGAVMAITHDLVSTISHYFAGLKELITGAFTLDTEKIKAGLAKIGDAFKKVGTDAAAGWNEVPKAAEKGLVQQDAVKKKFADKEAAAQREKDSLQRALLKAQNEGVLLELQDGSDKQIALKKQEVTLLTTLTSKKNGKEKDLLKQQLAAIREQEIDANTEELARTNDFNTLELAADKKYAELDNAQDAVLSKKELADLKKTINTKATTDADAYKAQFALQVKAHNEFLAAETQYGTAYAAINKVMQDAVVQGAAKGFSDLAALTSSNNAELKAIGQAASVANIVIKTAESAMNIYAGFSTIPFVGPELGVIGAAAAVAYGAEQIGTVLGANQGGVYSGGVAGKDSIPALYTPGELVAPEKNFDEVVNSVAASRNARDESAQGAQTAQAPGFAKVVIELKDDLMKFVETKIMERQRLNISLLPKLT